MSAKHHRFAPDYCCPPGATLRDWMEKRGQRRDRAARACRRMAPARFQRILDGTEPITPELAGALQAGTGISAKFWLNRERDYREGMAAGRTAAA